MRQNRCFPQSLQQVPHYAVLRQRLPEGALQDTQESMRGAGAGVVDVRLRAREQDDAVRLAVAVARAHIVDDEARRRVGRVPGSQS